MNGQEQTGRFDRLTKWLLVAGLLLIILGSVGVIVAKDRTNQSCRWSIWLDSDDTRTVRRPVTWAGFTQRVRVAGQRAWLAVWPEKPKGKVETMAAWIATGAGDATYNGQYNESGTYNGQPAYVLNAGGPNERWLWWAGVHWLLTEVLGVEPGPAYTSSAGALPANPWGASVGTPPAPTLAAGGTPPDWPWPWWKFLVSPDFGANTQIAPCAATLAGTSYIVLPSNDAVGGIYGFELFNLTTKTFQHIAAAGALFPPGGYDPYQTAACFNVGDGVHIWLFSGVWMDGAIPKFTCAKWSVDPAGVATLISTQDVTLDTQDITPFVEVSAGNYRFVLMDTDHLHYCTYAAGASSYTAGDPIALPALAAGYTDRRCGSTETGPFDQVLFVRGATTYWMRHARTVGGVDRIFPYAIAAGVVTPLADVLAVQFPTDYWRQTWGNDPVRGHALGDLGPPDNTNTNVATERWTPGTDGISHFTFATYPAQERWYLATGGVLYVVGWFDENYDHQPFVLDTTPIPTIIENVDGTARASGEATLQSLTPVDLTGEGIARGVGEAVLRAATLLIPEAGIARAVGEATLEASYNLTEEGPGGRSDLILTPGVWPGAKQRVTIPSFFDRMSNRRYGGALGTARPQWYAPIDESNELAEYVQGWSWVSDGQGPLVTNVGKVNDLGGYANDFTLEANYSWVDGQLVLGGAYAYCECYVPFSMNEDYAFTLLFDCTRTADDEFSGEWNVCNIKRTDYFVIHMDYEGDNSIGMFAAFTGEVTFPLPAPALNERTRFVISVHNRVDATVYVNGVLIGTRTLAEAGIGVTFNPGSDYFQLSFGACFTTKVQTHEGPAYTFEDPFYGIVHEVGFLSGYAATAADVATNPMFAMPYGLRGSPTPVTDRA